MTTRTSKGKILVVDDEFRMLKYYLLSLEREGYDVISVKGPAEALAEFDSAAFDLVILDVMMPPDMSVPGMEAAGIRDAGVHLAAILRKRSKDCKLLVFTNSSEREVSDWFKPDVNAMFIAKVDTDAQRFVSVVNSFLENRRPAPRVFIVHGRDRALLLEVKNFLQNNLRLPEPVILAEQRSGGATLIEKFEQHASQIDIAFVLMTPDDVGSLAGSPTTLESRARQNVVFELGYFMGRLGRKSGRVVVLHKGPLEIASDLSGILYIDVSRGVDSAGEEIRREMQAWI